MPRRREQGENKERRAREERAYSLGRAKKGRIKREAKI
jgi:hypothetical protein